MPFATSATMTTAPHFLPRTPATFAAPGLPVPTRRMSTRPLVATRVTMSADGVVPIEVGDGGRGERAGQGTGPEPCMARPPFRDRGRIVAWRSPAAADSATGHPAGCRELETREVEPRRDHASDERPRTGGLRRLPGVGGDDCVQVRDGPGTWSDPAPSESRRWSTISVPSRLTESRSGAPAWWHQISSASTRCQCERSPAQSRNEIDGARRSRARRRRRPPRLDVPPTLGVRTRARADRSVRARVGMHAPTVGRISRTFVGVRVGREPARTARGAAATRTGEDGRPRLTAGPGTPYGIRTRVTCVKGRRPGPLDERGVLENGGADDTSVASRSTDVGEVASPRARSDAASTREPIANSRTQIGVGVAMA